MNKFVGSIIKISFVIIALIGMHFYPHYWIDIIIAVPAAFFVEYFLKKPSFFNSVTWIYKPGRYIKYHINKWKMMRIIEAEQVEKYRKVLVDTAFEKALSKDKITRKIGLEQLSQFGAEETYKKLLDAIKNDQNKDYDFEFIKTLCKIISNMDINSDYYSGNKEKPDN